MSSIEILQRVDDFYDVVQTLSEVLNVENKALSEYDIDAVKALGERKTKIVVAYRSLTAYLIKNQTELASVDDTKKTELKEATKILDSLLKENELLLKTRMQTSQTVMDTIINIAKVTNNANATSYGSQGKYTPLDNNSNAMALNRTL